MHRFLGPTTRVSDLVSLGWNLRAFISHKFPGALGVTGMYCGINFFFMSVECC